MYFVELLEKNSCCSQSDDYVLKVHDDTLHTFSGRNVLEEGRVQNIMYARFFFTSITYFRGV